MTEMTNSPAHYIEDRDLARAWARAFMLVRDRAGHEVAPLLVSVTGFEAGVPVEHAAIRQALDGCLAATGMQEVNTVANTIFPESLWRMAHGDREKLYSTYLENLPSYVAMERHKNQRGLYFARLIAFNLDPRTGVPIATRNCPELPAGGNQLEYIIQKCKKGVRRSMFQAAVFDPARDHLGSAQLGFPCLQHVAFVPEFGTGSLAINAFYATQQIFERAYGNYLGLARLGAFVASQTGLKLTRLNCFTGVEKMDKRPAATDALTRLVAIVESALQAANTGPHDGEGPRAHA